MTSQMVRQLPEALCWHEGMLLSPQHFQQEQIYWGSQLQMLRQTMSPNSWGIVDIRFDKNALVEGQVRVQSLLAVMPDGMVVHFEEHDGHTLTLDLSENEALNQDRHVIVSIVVPIRVPGSASENATIQRYDSFESQPVMDENTGDNALVLHRLLPKYELMAVRQVSEKYVSCPILEVTQPDDGNYQLGRYCPPLVHLHAHEYWYEEGQSQQYQPLMRRAQQLALQMRKKARHLAGYTQSDDDRLGIVINDVHQTWIKVLTKNLVELELLADDPFTHPQRLYQLLSRLVGSFTELNLSCIPPKLPAYHHRDLFTGLDQAFSFLYQQMAFVNLNYTSIHFEESRSGVFTLHFDKAWSGRDLLVELTAKEGDTTEQVADWFKSCRIASRRYLETLNDKRLLGVAVEEIQSDPQTGISVTAGHALFRVKYDPKLIASGQQLVVICTSGDMKEFKPKRITVHLPHELDASHV